MTDSESGNTPAAESVEKRGRLHNVLVGILLGIGALLALLTAVGYLGRLWWRFDLVAHFRLQYLVCLLGAAVGLAALRRFRLAGVCLLVSVANLAAVAPLYLGSPAALDDVPVEERVRLRALSLNLHEANRNHEAVRALVRDEQPDLLLLMEYTERWFEDLVDLTDIYPHVIARPQGGPFGIALFSAHPFESADIEFIGEEPHPTVVARITIGDAPLTVIGTHPRPPLGAEASRLRNEQLADLADRAGQIAPPLLLLGDLNITRFSPYFRRLLAHSSLRDSAVGFGYQPTWPTYAPPLLIPIDHALVSEGVGILDRRVGPHVGSDHYPLIIDFELAPR